MQVMYNLDDTNTCRGKCLSGVCGLLVGADYHVKDRVKNEQFQSTCQLIVWN